MTTDVAVPQAFEDKLKQRIRDSIGELMSDDDLKKIVERSTAELLFNTRTTEGPRDHYGSRRTEQKPPLIQEILTPLINDAAYKAVTEWAKQPENEAKILAVINERLGRGLVDAIGMAIEQKFQNTFWQLQSNIKQALGLQP